MKSNHRHLLNSPKRSRKGFVSLEVILVLPMLMILLLGLLEFSLLFSARGEVIDAARAGGRLATLHGVDEYLIEDEVRRTLGRPLASYARVETQIGEHSGEEIYVRVRVPMAAATPDLLWPVGYSVKGQEIIGEVRMLKE